MRGEYSSISLLSGFGIGSTPHARGILSSRITQTAESRFTPACAGNTRINLLVQNIIKVHPRMRGEYDIAGVSTLGVKGSPPHARGILCQHNYNTAHPRFTPACAGNTWQNMNSLSFDKVHPRMRGEYNMVLCNRQDFIGSPPHARGIHKLVKDYEITSRFTPACAGNTFSPLPLGARS